MAAGADAWWRRAEEELRAARFLDDSAFPVQAYFHAGQAVEFGLKAIYLRRRNLREMPGYARGARWHDLTFLAEQAGLAGDLRRLHDERQVADNWTTVLKWRSDGRYPGQAPPEVQLESVFRAASDERNGVVTWLGSIFRTT